MAVITGATGSVTSWTGTANGLLIGTNSQPSTFTLNYNADELDTTGFDATNSMEAIAGLKSWAGTISTRYDAAQIGSAGSVTYGSGYVLHTNSWQLNLASAAKDVTAFGTSVKSFIPSLIGWGGQYDGFVDDTSPLSGLGVDPPASATFAMDATRSIEGDITVTGQSVSSAPSEPNTVTQTFRGSGAITAAGASGLFSVGEIVIPATGTLTLTASTGRTYAGSAFWTSLSISCPAAGLVVMDIAFQGTGALSIG